MDTEDRGDHEDGLIFSTPTDRPSTSKPSQTACFPAKWSEMMAIPDNPEVLLTSEATAAALTENLGDARKPAGYKGRPAFSAFWRALSTVGPMRCTGQRCGCHRRDAPTSALRQSPDDDHASPHTRTPGIAVRVAGRTAVRRPLKHGSPLAISKDGVPRVPGVRRTEACRTPRFQACAAGNT
jgi:hypothetical protein